MSEAHPNRHTLRSVSRDTLEKISTEISGENKVSLANMACFSVRPRSAALGVKQTMEVDPSDGQPRFVPVLEDEIIHASSLSAVSRVINDIESEGKIASERTGYPVYPFIRLLDIEEPAN